MPWVDLGTVIAFTGRMQGPFLTMLATALPAKTDITAPTVIQMLLAIPPGLWNGYTLAQTPEGKAGALEMMRRWITEFGVAML
jgi:hypothetical protein